MYIELYVKRREAKMSQTDVAKKLNISRQTYSLKEQGEYDFSVKEAKKLSKLFNTPLDELFKDMEEGA